MKKTLTYLPKNKKVELEKITKTIRELCNDIEMIILFGSYGRGDWKECLNTIIRKKYSADYRMDRIK